MNINEIERGIRSKKRKEDRRRIKKIKVFELKFKYNILKREYYDKVHSWSDEEGLWSRYWKIEKLDDSLKEVQNELKDLLKIARQRNKDIKTISKFCYRFLAHPSEGIMEKDSTYLNALMVRFNSLYNGQKELEKTIIERRKNYATTRQRSEQN